MDVEFYTRVGSLVEGHWFSLELNVENGLVVDLHYGSPKMTVALALGAYLEEVLLGQKPRLVTVEELRYAMNGLPPSRAFYAWMVAEAVKKELTTPQQLGCIAVVE